MSLQEHYLRAADRASMEAALRSAGLMASGGQGVALGAAIDHIGPVPGNDAWHTNLIVQVPLTPEQVAALPLIAPPATPVREFFADE